MTPKNIYTIKNNQQEMERQGLRLLETGVQIGVSTQFHQQNYENENGGNQVFVPKGKTYTTYG